MPLPFDLIRADEGTIVFYDAEIGVPFEGRQNKLVICDLAVLIEDAEVQCIHIGGDKDTLGEVIGPSHWLHSAAVDFLSFGIPARSIEYETLQQIEDARERRAERRAA